MDEWIEIQIASRLLDLGMPPHPALQSANPVMLAILAQHKREAAQQLMATKPPTSDLH